MARQPVHMERSRTLENTQVHDGVTSNLYRTSYWCGKMVRAIEDDAPLSADEQKAHAKCVAREERDPSPICGKCFAAKAKFNDHQPAKDGE